MKGRKVVKKMQQNNYKPLHKLRLNIIPTEAKECGPFGCVQWTEDYLGWEKLGVGRMLVFLGVEGLAFYLLITLVEMKVFEQIRYLLARLKRAITPWKIGE